MAEKIYNIIHKCIIILNEDQHECPLCKGTGYHSKIDGDDNGEYDLLECHLCDGDGYVDWITIAATPPWKEHDKSLLKEEEEEEWETNFWKEVEDCYNGSFTVDGDWEDYLGYG